MASEIDRFANQSYEILYGHPTAGDVTKVAAEDVPDHDLLVGGFPCQAFSVAGKRLGFDDTRGTLFFEIARIAKVKQPRALLLENVKGLIGHDKGKTLDTIVQTLHDIGYTVDFNVMNSKYFAVPQNRERIFIVAIRNDLVTSDPWNVGKRSDVVAKGKRRVSEMGVSTFNFDWPAQEEVTVRLRDILESDVDEKFYLSEEKTAKLVAQLRDREVVVLDQREDDEVNAIISPDVIKKNQNGTRIKPNDAPMSALTVIDRHGIVEPKIAEEQAKMAEIATPDNLSYCIDANYTKGIAPSGIGKGRRTHVEETSPNYRIRKLTPRECFRLQGFPDSEFDKLSANGISNSQLYKQAGNAVTVNVIDALGRRLLEYVNKEAN